MSRPKIHIAKMEVEGIELPVTIAYKVVNFEDRMFDEIFVTTTDDFDDFLELTGGDGTRKEYDNIVHKLENGFYDDKAIELLSELDD